MANIGSLLSPEAALSVAIQATKGTPQTANFITALLTTSLLSPQFDTVEKGVEHGAGTGNQRPTGKRSRTTRTGHRAEGEFAMAAYTRALVPFLVGAGFKVTTTDQTTHQQHVLTIADRDAISWLTVLREWEKEWRATDCKIQNLVIAGDPTSGLTCNGQIYGITVDEAVGTETKTLEQAVELNPTTGSISIILDPDGVALEAAYSGGDQAAENVSLTIDNPLDTEQRRMFIDGRADLPPQGVLADLVVGGIDVDMDIWDIVVNGGVGNTTPSLITALAAIDYTHESASNIPGAGVPYSMQVAIPYAEIELDPAGVRANDNESVRWTFNASMLDDAGLLGASEPITITILNDQATY